MIRPWSGYLAALEHLKSRSDKDVVYPKRRRNILIRPPDSKTLCQPCILPATTDGRIRVGVGHVIEVPADKCRMRTGIQSGPYLFRLIPAMTERIPKLSNDGPGSIHNAVIDVSDDLQ